jgi:hypothetical protein
VYTEWVAKPSQTFKKRQRELKLREKAQQKRERRQQRQIEKRASQAKRAETNDAYSGGTEVSSDAGRDISVDDLG